MTQIIVSGGGGFIGSHVAEYYAKQEGTKVIVIDNLSRANLLHQDKKNTFYNFASLSHQSGYFIFGFERGFSEPANCILCIS